VVGRRTGFAAAFLVVGLLAGCTNAGDGGSRQGVGGEPERHDDAAAVPVHTVTSLDTVVGRLGSRQREILVDEVTELVDHWWDTAFVDVDYPGTEVRGAFRDFTRSTARAARKDRAMSNAQVGDRVEEIEVVRRRLRIDVFAVGNRPAGATARVTLRMNLSGEIERTDRIRGRLLLTPGDDGWVVFGYDVRRERVTGE
jgi:hypothetical protein